MSNSTSTLQYIQNSEGHFTVKIKVDLLHTLNVTVQSLGLLVGIAEHP